jgi:hypothetical protein
VPKSLGKQATFDLDLALNENNSMGANVSPQALSSPVAATGRSLLSRLTSPLRSRTRNLADFHIQPFEPHRQYSPGDTVKGLVVLTVVKPIRITHLTVALHGIVRVHKDQKAKESATHDSALMTATNSTTTQYFGNGQASLFQDEIILCGEGRLEVGVYEFEFNLEFPAKGLPSSIDVSSHIDIKKKLRICLHESSLREAPSPT